MNFIPTGKVYILSGIPFDSTYQNTRSFSSLSSQVTWMQGKILKSMPEVSFIKDDKTIKVPFSLNELRTANYIMFKNAEGDKWIYSFINKMEYVSDNVTKLFYETDVLQTFMFDYTLKPSFVEREHIVGDEIGANLVPENLETGEYVVNSETDTGVMDSNDFCFLVSSLYDVDGSPLTSSSLGGVHSPIGVLYFDTLPHLHYYLDQLNYAVGKIDGILSITLVPKFLVIEQINGGLIDQVTKSTVTRTIPAVGTINGYTPRNKKLFTHPYNMMIVSNNMGNHAEIRREFLDDKSTYSFLIAGNMAGNPSVACVPTGYKGLTQNYNEMITLNNFPQLPFQSDTYKNWLMQNSNSMIVGTLSSGLSLAMGVATGNPMAIAGGLVGASQSIGAMMDRAKVPNQARGNSNGAYLNVTLGRMDFNFYQVSITQEQAKVIDDFFHMYGYKTNRVKVPNTATRSAFNYVKTIGCNLDGNFDNETKLLIKSIYDKGLTIWHTDNFNYNVTNGEV